MTTTVTDRILRPRSYDMFASVTDAAVLRFEQDAEANCWTVTFNADLDAAKVAEIRALMTSRDDADQARRADLAARIQYAETWLTDNPNADPHLRWLTEGLRDSLRWALGGGA